jgi:hypothetical protein
MQDVHGQVFHAKISGSPIVFNKKKSLQVTMVECPDIDYGKQTSIGYKTMIDSFGLPYFITNESYEIKEISSSSIFNGLSLKGCNINELDVFVAEEKTNEMLYSLKHGTFESTLFKGHVIKDSSGKVLEIFFYPSRK